MGIKRITLNAAVLMIIGLGLINKSQCITYLSDYVKIAKCCPQGTELSVFTNKTGKTEYDCELTRSETNETFFGYNLKISNDTQLPTCGDVELFDFDIDGGLISSDGCIDMYNGVLHGLKCSDKFQVEVHKLFKCCAEGKNPIL